MRTSSRLLRIVSKREKRGAKNSAFCADTYKVEKLLNYKSWKRRNILVLKMLTATDILESSLQLMGIPHIVYDTKIEPDLQKQWKKDQDTVCGIIISGSRTDHELHIEPAFPEEIIESLPVLGLCYGHEILGNLLGSKVVDCNPPYGEHSMVEISLHEDLLFEGIDVSKKYMAQMNHDQMLQSLPTGAKLLASTSMTPVAGFHHDRTNWWGLQFHPEKDWSHNLIFKNFYRFCRS